MFTKQKKKSPPPLVVRIYEVEVAEDPASPWQTVDRYSADVYAWMDSKWVKKDTVGPKATRTELLMEFRGPEFLVLAD